MKNLRVNILLIGAIIAGSIMINACDDGYRINTKKLISEEKELMEDYFYAEEDSLAQLGDSINELEESGFAFFETQEGTGDSVVAGKNVGFRYVYYEIVRDSLGTPFLYPYESNYRSEGPKIYTAGTTNMYNGIYAGLDIALQNMAYGSKARVFVYSSLWTSDYTPRVIDLEVTYVEK